MGLNVHAYRQIRKLDVLFDADGQPVDPLTRAPVEGDYFRATVNSDFPSQAEGVEHRGVYAFADEDHFWSGGYGHYGRWRETLAKLAGYTAVLHERVPGFKPSEVMSHTVGAFEVEDGPFHELVCFSDCEGCIGTVVSAELARDFAEWDDRAKATGDAWFYEKYAEWRRCFEMAADGGAVTFG